MASIDSHRDLEVYKRAFAAAMRVFEVTKFFPREENYSLTDQIRRSSRSVAANLTEAWRKRRYEAAFVAKLSDAETEAAETQTWIEFAFKATKAVVITSTKPLPKNFLVNTPRSQNRDHKNDSRHDFQLPKMVLRPQKMTNPMRLRNPILLCFSASPLLR